MTLELDELLDILMHGERAVASLRKVLIEARSLDAFKLIVRVDSPLRLGDDLDVEIRRQYAVLLSWSHLFQDHRQRVRLCADGATRTPDIELG